jgi:poly(3-hydroxybutyrate) depolymerase
MVTMRRRNLILGLTATVAGALTGCGTQDSGIVVSTTGAGTPSATPTGTSLLSSTGRSSLAARAVTLYVPKPGTAPAQAFAVGRRDFSFVRGDRQLPVRVWYPAGGAAGGDPADDAAPAPGTFPVVLFSHGLTAQPDDYAAMLVRWAQAGFVVAGPKYPYTWFGAADVNADDIVNQPADASYVLTRMLALDDPLGAHLDAARIGAAGHSGGGITTAGLFSSERDSRLTAGIILAGTDFRSAPFAGPAAAMLFVHGRQDGTVAYDAGHTVFKAVPWPRAMLTITAGGHVTTAADFETITGTSTDFLRWSLYGDAAAKSRIPARAAVNGVATLENQL